MLCRGTATALLACAGAAFADRPPEIASLPQWVSRAQERLELQPAQQRQLRALVDTNAARLEQVRLRITGDSLESRRALREAMATLQTEFRAGLAGVLSPGQLAEWDALVEELLGRVHLRNAPRLAESAR